MSITVISKCKTILYDGLAQLLSFKTTRIEAMEADVSKEIDYIADPGTQYRVLMIYTDIIEPEVVGDILAPLLRIVNVNGNDGEMVTAQYDRPAYLLISLKIIDTIKIVIRNHMGHLAAFERGRSYVKLHFRQKHLA